MTDANCANSAETQQPSSSEGAAEPEVRTKFLRFALAWVVWILAVLVVCGYRFLPNIPTFPELISPERIPYLLAFIGTTLGAVGATSKKGEPVTAPIRDALSLWGWAFVSVGSLVALLFAQVTQ